MPQDLPYIEAYPDLPRTALIVPNGSSGIPWALLSGGMISAIISEGAEGDAEGERLRKILNRTKLPWLSVGGVLARALWRSIAVDAA